MQSRPTATSQHDLPTRHSESSSSNLNHGLPEHQPVDSLLVRDELQQDASEDFLNAPQPGDVARGEITGASLQPLDESEEQHDNSRVSYETTRHWQVLLYLPPASLVELSHVSRRFHSLVLDPHAWRLGFAKFFPGHLAIRGSKRRDVEETIQRDVQAERRQFTRLTMTGTWQREYIVRTQLLRSLARGKPLLTDKQRKTVSSTSSPRSRRSQGEESDASSSLVMYHTHLRGTVTHLDASFAMPGATGRPGLIHASTDFGISVTLSNPDGWTGGRKELFTIGISSFDSLFRQTEPYGLGAGEFVGGPAVMDVSHLYGFIYSQNVPEGVLLFGSIGARANVLDITDRVPADSVTLPRIEMTMVNQTAAWIAKTRSIPAMSNGLIGMLSGSCVGVLTAYCCSHDRVISPYLSPGQKTVRWALCPGVPIIAIKVDEHYNERRKAEKRIWAAVLNALGEVFYISDMPKMADNFIMAAEACWDAGRTAKWHLIESTRRSTKSMSSDQSGFNWRTFPRSTSEVGLSREKLVEEANDINTFLNYRPRHFQAVCTGWDMRRLLEVDFAGGDETGAAEAIFVINPGFDEGNISGIKRYTRFRKVDISTLPQEDDFYSLSASNSSVTSLVSEQEPELKANELFDISKVEDGEEWRITKLTFPNMKAVQITATAVDNTALSVLNLSEDPLLNPDAASTDASTSSSVSDSDRLLQSSDIPGGRARFFAIGTSAGTIAVWNMRARSPNSTRTVPWLRPLRFVNTDSPVITSLALTSLYLVHGGNDGLVQVWDPMASNTAPVRTLNSKMAARARRLINHAFQDNDRLRPLAARAISLHQDARVLYGVASIGSHIRFWSFSAAFDESVPSKKKRPRRRGSRRSSSGDDNLTTKAVRSLKKYIDYETMDMERIKEERTQESRRLKSQFGMGMFGADVGADDEVLAYAQMLSEEAYQQELERRGSTPSSVLETVTETPEMLASDPTENTFSALDLSSSSPQLPSHFSSTDITTNEQEDADLAEAIRLSLLDEPVTPSRQQSIAGLEDEFPPLSATPEGGKRSKKGKGRWDFD